MPHRARVGQVHSALDAKRDSLDEICLVWGREAGTFSATLPTHLIYPSWASTQVPASSFLFSGYPARALFSKADPS